ncbi:MAG: SPOR domain-containing protein [Prevotella sp.]|nr:SPOR domain-containing protein [Prevotella sp.]
MKKYLVLCVSLCIAFAFTSCKSSESAYRKAYEKAQAQENNGEEYGNEEIAVVAPVVERPATDVVVDNVDNVPVRTENVSMVNGDGLRNFSVVVGSFSVQANAEGLQSTLRNQGYEAQIAFNPSIEMYRVIAATFDIKSDAVRSRNELRSQFPDAWLLSNQ